MLSLFFPNKRTAVHRLLANRMNRAVFERLPEKDRRNARSMFSEVVWLIPGAERGRPDFAAAIPAVGKDISPRGVALIHTAPVAGGSVLLALQGLTGTHVLRCTCQHSTALGYGFYQIGLNAEEIVVPSNGDTEQLRRRIAQFAEPPSAG
jgi:hypothetical protein